MVEFLLQVDEYLADPQTFPTNRMMLQAYKDGAERGVFVKPTVFPHFLPNKRELAMYKVESCDPKAKSCDQKAKSCDQKAKSCDKSITEESGNPKSNM